MSGLRRSITEVLDFLTQIGEDYKDKMKKMLAGIEAEKEAYRECLAELAAKTLGALQAYAEIQEADTSKNYTNRQYTTNRPEEYIKIIKILRAIKGTASYEFRKYAASDNKNHPFKETEYSLRASKFLYWFTEGYVENRFDINEYKRLSKKDKRNLKHWYMKSNTCGQCQNPYTDSMFIDYRGKSNFAPFNSSNIWNMYNRSNTPGKVGNLDELERVSPNAAEFVKKHMRKKTENTELLERYFGSGKRNESLFPGLEELGHE